MDTPKFRANSHFLRLSSFVLVLTILYLGREVFVPLALAVLLAFMLSPLVGRLYRWRLPRGVSVVAVSVVVFSALALVGWLLAHEMHHLASELPSHRQNIQRRVTDLKNMGEGRVVGNLRQLASDVTQSDKDQPSSNKTSDNSAAPDPKIGLPSRMLDLVLTTLGDALSTAGLVVLYVIFLLLRQEDIAQRIVRLVGYTRLTITMKVMDEVGHRVSRYLLTQCTINGVYGVLLATGLACIGLPYIVLWGVLAALFRFIPYVGPCLVAVLPIGLSFAVFDGWSQPLMVIGLILTLELVTNMILEPMLYGQSVGVSDFGLLLAITFWTWLWGGIGLVLATPLTVCIVVFCKYVPTLEWVEILMGEKATPQPHLQFYQRMLAGDEDAVFTLIETKVKQDGLGETLDKMVLPALALVRREAVLGRLEKIEAADVYAILRSAITLLHEERVTDDVGATETASPAAVKIIFGRAMHGEADARALEMLAQVLPADLELRISSAPQLTGELMQDIRDVKPALICISAMPPGAHLGAAVLCRRLRGKFPHLKILVCSWTLPGQALDAKPLKEAGADWVATSLSDVSDILKRSFL